MFTKIDLCSMALLKIGERPIQSLTENSAGAALSRTLFDITTDNLLASHPWRFATFKRTLEKNTDGEFELPPDVLRVLSCDTPRWAANTNKIQSDAKKISATMICRVNTDAYPSYFASVVATKLAMEFCIPLTDNHTAHNTLAQLFEIESRNAKFIDSAGAPNSEISNWPLLSVRY
jgi:hypothetical protein